MQDQRFDRARCSGKTQTFVILALVLAIAAALAVLYKPWNVLRYGSAQPPLPTSTDLEPPLATRISERVERVRAKPYDPQAWGALGETYDVHEIFPQAIFCYERAQLLAPQEARWPYLLGLAQRIGDQKAALVSFERAIALAPDMAAAHFFAAHGYLQSERYDDAKREFTRALELEPEAPATLIGLAKVSLSKADPKAALELLDRAQKQHPQTKEANWLMAAAWRAQGDEAKALQFANPGDPPPTQEAFPDRLRAQQQNTEGVTLRFARMRAELLLSRNEPEQAVKELERYLDLVPTSAAAQEAFGDLYMKLDKPEQAIPRYQAALTIDPTRSNALGNWADALARTGKPDEAVAKLRQALKADPSAIEFKSNLAAILANSKSKEERQESLALMEEVSRARPDDTTAWVNLANARGANGLADEAIAAFQQALKLAPNDLSLRHMYGILCARVDKLEPAAEAFAAVVQADPSLMVARANLIHALTTLGRYREAIAALRSVHEIAPETVQWRAQLAWLLATCPEDSVRSASEALTLARALVAESHEKNPEMLVILSAAQAESNDFPEALKSVAAALELFRPLANGQAVEDPAMVGIIDQALGCQKAYKDSKPFRITTP